MKPGAGGLLALPRNFAISQEIWRPITKWKPEPLGMLLPIGLVISNAWFQILTSRMARTEDPVTMHFYTGWVGTLLASLALPY